MMNVDLTRQLELFHNLTNGLRAETTALRAETTSLRAQTTALQDQNLALRAQNEACINLLDLNPRSGHLFRKNGAKG